MKNRMSSIDLKAEVVHLQHLVGLRVANIYDLNLKTFIFKFYKPDYKGLLLIESGIRMHLTEFMREKPTAPGPFTSMLRKFLRTKRLLSIQQMGMDRVVLLQFSGEEPFNVIIELYAQGNLILTDQNFKIIGLLRSHQFDEDVKYAKNEIYPFEHAANLSITQPLSPDEIRPSVEKLYEKGKNQSYKMIVLGICTYMHVPFAEHCVRACGNNDVNKKIAISDVDYELLHLCMNEGLRIIQEIKNSDPVGYLIYSQDSLKEFTPILFEQHNDMRVETLSSFDQAIDQYFTAFEKQKEETKIEKQENEVWKKKNKIQKDQEQRINNLQNQQEDSVRKAQLIEMNIDVIEQLFGILRNCLDTGVDWTELRRMIQEEKARGNPFACIIKKLKLEKNIVQVSLVDPETNGELDVDLGIYKNAHQNARDYFDLKKFSKKKEEKTRQAVDDLLKKADKEAKAELKKQEMRIGKGIRHMRKPYWFEKFHWFISSENYVVVAGKDVQQNEILVKKHLKKGDVYVHAQVHGASSTIIKNHLPDLLVPQQTLEEAGAFCICMSSAWDAKVVVPAFWVFHTQVSKTAPTGLFLPTGSFMIRGKRNFIRPPRLEMAVVLLFKLDDDSLARHKDERKIVDDENMSEVSTDQLEVEDTGDEFIVSTAPAPKPQQQKQQPKAQPKGKNKNQKGKKKEEETKEEVQPKEDNKPLTKKQKKKLKMIQKKYGDIDDEDNKLKMQLLGSKPVAFANKARNKEDLDNEESKGEDDEREETEENPESETEENTGLETEENQEEENETEENPEEEIEENKEENEIKQILEEENLLAEEELALLEETSTLTGQPLEEDTLLYCLPMCAPSIATNNYKYKTKVQPGSMKKGKAAKMISYIWLSTCNAEIEKNMIKALSETDFITIIPGKTNVMAAGQVKQEFSKKR